MEGEALIEVEKMDAEAPVYPAMRGLVTAIISFWILYVFVILFLWQRYRKTSLEIKVRDPVEAIAMTVVILYTFFVTIVDRWWPPFHYSGHYMGHFLNFVVPAYLVLWTSKALRLSILYHLNQKNFKKTLGIRGPVPISLLSYHSHRSKSTIVLNGAAPGQPSIDPLPRSLSSSLLASSSMTAQAPPLGPLPASGSSSHRSRSSQVSSSGHGVSGSVSEKTKGHSGLVQMSLADVSPSPLHYVMEKEEGLDEAAGENPVRRSASVPNTCGGGTPTPAVIPNAPKARAHARTMASITEHAPPTMASSSAADSPATTPTAVNGTTTRCPCIAHHRSAMTKVLFKFAKRRIYRRWTVGVWLLFFIGLMLELYFFPLASSSSDGMKVTIPQVVAILATVLVAPILHYKIRHIQDVFSVRVEIQVCFLTYVVAFVILTVLTYMNNDSYHDFYIPFVLSCMAVIGFHYSVAMPMFRARSQHRFAASAAKTLPRLAVHSPSAATTSNGIYPKMKLMSTPVALLRSMRDIPSETVPPSSSMSDVEDLSYTYASMDACFEDPELYLALQQRAVRSFCFENLDCMARFTALLTFATGGHVADEEQRLPALMKPEMCSPRLLWDAEIPLFRAFYDDFLTTQSKMELNVPSQMRAEVALRIQDDPATWRTDMFDAIWRHTYQNIFTGLYLGFVQERHDYVRRQQRRFDHRHPSLFFSLSQKSFPRLPSLSRQQTSAPVKSTAPYV